MPSQQWFALFICFLLSLTISFLPEQAAAQPVPAIETVSLRSAARLPTPLQQDQARKRGLIANPIPGDEIKGFLAKPAGPGPFPAAIIMHGCAGLSERFKQALAERFVSWGYAALIVDSFANHEVKFACGDSRAESRANARPWDAIGALTYLATLSFVDKNRIALVGYSQGAWAALEVAQKRPFPIYDTPHGLSFKAIVTYYPDCRIYYENVTIPTLILIGDADEWTPAGKCREMLERLTPQSAPIDLVVYPNAHHAFDWSEFATPRKVAGYQLIYDPKAAQDALEKQRQFLIRHIGQ